MGNLRLRKMFPHPQFANSDNTCILKKNNISENNSSTPNPFKQPLSCDIFDRNDQSEDVVRLRQDLGDGGCRVLMSFMKGKNLVAPLDWDGVRKLSSK